jgi:hypothetical protein
VQRGTGRAPACTGRVVDRGDGVYRFARRAHPGNWHVMPGHGVSTAEATDACSAEQAEACPDPPWRGSRHRTVAQWDRCHGVEVPVASRRHSSSAPGSRGDARRRERSVRRATPNTSGMLALAGLQRRVHKQWVDNARAPIGLHEARHTAATWLDHAGVSPKVASQLMGTRRPSIKLGPPRSPCAAIPTPSRASSNGRASSSTRSYWTERRKRWRSDDLRFFPPGFPPVTALRSTRGISGPMHRA